MSSTVAAKVIASVNRALWGEVPRTLRSVQFRAIGRKVDLRFVFDREPTGEERESVNCIAAEVAADFPNHLVEESVLAATRTSKRPQVASGWHVAYARKEPSHRSSPATAKRYAHG